MWPVARFVIIHEVRIVEASTSAARTERQRVALGVVHATAYDSQGNPVPVNILYDEGSPDTLIRAGLARRLGIVGTEQILKIDGVAATSTSIANSEKVRLTLRAGNGETYTVTGSTMPVVTRPVPYTDWSQLKTRWRHLADLELTNSTGGQVDLLLGLDHSHLMAVLESHHGAEFEPIASRTRLGWVVRGVVGVDVSPDARTHAAFVAHAVGQTSSGLDATFKRFGDTEAFGSEHQTPCISKLVTRWRGESGDWTSGTRCRCSGRTENQLWRTTGSWRRPVSEA